MRLGEEADGRGRAGRASAPGGRVSGRKTTTTSGAKRSSASRSGGRVAARRGARGSGCVTPGAAPSGSAQASKKVDCPTKAMRSRIGGLRYRPCDGRNRTSPRRSAGRRRGPRALRRRALAAGDASTPAPGAVITCLDVLEQLDHFLPVVEALVDAAASAARRSSLRVPNTPLTGRRGASTLGRGRLRGAARAAARRRTSCLHQVPLRGAARASGERRGRSAVEVEVAGHDAAEPLRRRLRAARGRGRRRGRGRARATWPPSAPSTHRLRSDVAFLEARVRELEARLGPAAGARRSCRREGRLPRQRPAALAAAIGVVVAHARQLHDRHGFDVTLVLAREQEEPALGARRAARACTSPRSSEAARRRTSTSPSRPGGRPPSSLFELRAERYA